jgi:hypothetical protein
LKDVLPSFKNLIDKLAFEGLNETCSEVGAADMLDEHVNDAFMRLFWNILTTPNEKSMILRVAEVIDAETAREEGMTEFRKPLTSHLT